MLYAMLVNVIFYKLAYRTLGCKDAGRNVIFFKNHLTLSTKLKTHIIYAFSFISLKFNLLQSITTIPIAKNNHLISLNTILIYMYRHTQTHARTCTCTHAHICIMLILLVRKHLSFWISYFYLIKFSKIGVIYLFITVIFLIQCVSKV